MSDRPVRVIGTVTDVHGRTVRVGVDCDAVTIGSDYTLGAAVRDDFARLFFAADEAAKAWAAAYEPEPEACGEVSS